MDQKTPKKPKGKRPPATPRKLEEKHNPTGDPKLKSFEDHTVRKTFTLPATVWDMVLEEVTVRNRADLRAGGDGSFSESHVVADLLRIALCSPRKS